MPATSRILEILFYSLVRFLPLLFLLLYPFRNRLRLSAGLTGLLSAILAGAYLAVNIAIFFLYGGSSHLWRVLFAAAAILFYILAVRASVMEMLLNLITVVILGILAATSAKGLEMIIFPHLAREPAHWTYSLILMILDYIIVFLYSSYYHFLLDLPGKRNRKIHLSQDSSPEDSTQNSKVSTAEFHAAEFVQSGPVLADGSGESPCESSSPVPIATAPEAPDPSTGQEQFPEAAESQDPDPAATESDVPSLSEPAPSAPVLQDAIGLQYGNFLHRFQESEAAYGAFQEHLDTVIQELEFRMYEPLRSECFALKQEQIPQSEDKTLNRILTHYFRTAQTAQIRITADISVTAPILIDTQDMAVLLCNLLDNAVEACLTQCHSKRRLHVYCHQVDDELQIAVKNTFEHPVMQDEDGSFQSNKHGVSIHGLELIRNIVSRYHGNLDIQHEDGVFLVELTLFADSKS